MSEELSAGEVLALFWRAPDQERQARIADSEEYRNLVTYLVERSNNLYRGWDRT